MKKKGVQAPFNLPYCLGILFVFSLSLAQLVESATDWERIEFISGRVINTRTQPSISAVASSREVKSDGFINSNGHDEEENNVRADSMDIKQYLLQLHSPITPYDRSVLEELTHQPLNIYIPNGAYVFFGDLALAKKVESSSLVRWVGVRPSSTKLHFMFTQSRSSHLHAQSPLVSTSFDPSSFRTDGDGRICLWVSLVHSRDFPKRKSAASLVKAWKKIASSRGTFEEEWKDVANTIREASQNKIEIWLKPVLATVVGVWVSRMTEVDGIEVAPVLKLKNKYARNLMMGQPITTAWNANYLYLSGLNGTNQIVGYADSGIDYDNCMFWDPTGIPANNAVDIRKRKIIAYVSYSSGCGRTDGKPCADYMDDNEGHGTHVGGSIGGYPSAPSAQANEVAAAIPYSGMALGAKLFFTDIGDTATNALWPPVDLSTGLFPDPYAAGARIHSDSWGCYSDQAGGCDYYSSSSREVDDYMFQHQDFLVLIAAGNSGGMGGYTVESPATSKNCIAVGASDTALEGFQSATAFMDPNAELCGGTSDPTCCATKVCTSNNCCPDGTCCSSAYLASYYGSDDMAEFSSQGYTMSSNQLKTYGRVKPDLVGVGTAIVSANSDGNVASFGAGSCQCRQPVDPGTTYSDYAALIPMSGTSMATPVTAGMATIVRQYFVDGWYPSGAPVQANKRAPSAALVKAVLIAASKPLVGKIWNSQLSSMVDLPKTIPNANFGFGRPDLSRVLLVNAATGSSNTLQLWIDDYATNSGLATGDSSVYNFGGVTSSTSAPFTVALVWTDPPASLTSANQLVNNLDLLVTVGGSTSYKGNMGTAADTVNNVEVVVLTSLSSASSITIQVLGTNVAQSRQTFALVVSGSWTVAPGNTTIPVGTSSVSLSAASVAAGSPITATITLSAAVSASKSLTISFAFSGSATNGVATNPSSSVTLSSGSSSSQFTITPGSSTNGVLTLSYSLSGTAATAFTGPSPSIITVIGSLSLSSLPTQLFFTQTSSSITISTNGSPVSSSTPLTVSLSTSGSTLTTSSASLVYSGASSATFSVTAGSSAGTSTISYSLSGPGSAYFSSSSLPNTVITISAPTAISVTSWQQNLFVTRSQSGLTLNIGQAVPQGGSLTASLSLSGPAATDSSVSPTSLSFSGSTTTSTFSITAGQTIGALTLAIAISGPSTLAYTPPAAAAYVAAVSSLSSATASAPSQAVSSTSATVTLALGSAVPSGGSLTVAISLSGSTATTSSTSVVFSSGMSSSSFTVTPTQTGTLTISFALSGPSAIGYTSMASISISVVQSPTPCPAGQFGPTGQTPCQPCAVASYQTLTGQTSCVPCPQGQSTASTGSTTADSCKAICVAGQYGSGGISPCSPCAVGTYSTQSGMSSCQPCPSGQSTATTGATSSSACAGTCAAGTFSNNGLTPCTACAIGSYQSSTATTACTSCASGYSTINTGSAAASSCKAICAAGSSGPSGLDPCTLCPKGSYSTTAMSTTCTTCSTGTSTVSTGSTQCLQLCASGTYSSNAGGVTPCQSCTAGTYSSAAGATNCTSCAVGTTTSSSGATSATSCNVCIAGWMGSASGGPPCSACPKGSYSANTGSSSCTTCPSNQNTPTTGSTTCSPLCPPGYSGTGGVSPCTACATGSYAEGNGTSSCQQCAKGQVTLQPGSTTNAACVALLQLAFPPASAAGFVWLMQMSRMVSWISLNDPSINSRQVQIQLFRNSDNTNILWSVVSANDGSEVLDASKLQLTQADDYIIQLTLLPSTQTPSAVVRSAKFSFKPNTNVPNPAGVMLAMQTAQSIPAYGSFDYITLRDYLASNIANALQVLQYMVEIASISAGQRRRATTSNMLIRVNIYPDAAVTSGPSPQDIANTLVAQASNQNSALRSVLPNVTSASVVSYAVVSEPTSTSSPAPTDGSMGGLPSMLIWLLIGGGGLVIIIIAFGVFAYIRHNRRGRSGRLAPPGNRAQATPPRRYQYEEQSPMNQPTAPPEPPAAYPASQQPYSPASTSTTTSPTSTTDQQARLLAKQKYYEQEMEEYTARGGANHNNNNNNNNNNNANVSAPPPVAAMQVELDNGHTHSENVPLNGHYVC